MKEDQHTNDKIKRPSENQDTQRVSLSGITDTVSKVKVDKPTKNDVTKIKDCEPKKRGRQIESKNKIKSNKTSLEQQVIDEKK